MRSTGGEAEMITDVKSGVGGFAWSPDGKWIAFTMTDPPTADEEKNNKGKDDSRWIDENVKMNHLYVVPGWSERRRRQTRNAPVDERRFHGWLGTRRRRRIRLVAGRQIDCFHPHKNAEGRRLDERECLGSRRGERVRSKLLRRPRPPNHSRSIHPTANGSR